MNFWEVHGLLPGLIFLVCIALFPRLTLLIATVWGGFLWWVGLFLAPRLAVAIIATTMYWDTNPVLCVLAWIVALSGESTEKKTVHKRCSNAHNS